MEGSSLESQDTVKNVTASGNNLTVTLKNQTYSLRMARVGVGTGTTDPGAKYIVDIQGDETSIAEGGEQKLVAEVRDRFNNPVSNVSVSASITQAANAGDPAEGVSPSSETTADGGEASVTYTAPDDVDGTQNADIEITFDDGNEDTERVVFDVQVLDADGSGSGGGANANGAGGVGIGGEETYDSSDTVRDIANPGGVWTDMNGVVQVLLSDPKLSPRSSKDSSFEETERFFHLTYSVESGSTRYYVVFGSEELKYNVEQDKWEQNTAHIIKQQGTTVEFVRSADIDTSVLQAWYDPSAATSEPIRLLTISTYSDEKAEFRETLTELKQFHRNRNVDMFFSDLHGRVTLNATPVGKGLTYPDEFDGPESGTTQENDSIPPSTTAGDTLEKFENLQVDDSDNAKFKDDRDITGTELRAGTAMYGVKNASSYTIEVNYVYEKSGTDPVTVDVVDAGGTTLQTVDLPISGHEKDQGYSEETYTLDPDATDEVQSSGNLYLVYRSGDDDADTELGVRYIRVRAG